MGTVSKIAPRFTPQAKLARIAPIIAHIDRKQFPVVLVGVRGYYRDTMGKAGVNDRGIYDDAIFLISPDSFNSFNANCDPGAFARGIANLRPGTWFYKIGIHGLSKPKAQQYKALVQAADVTVLRDGKGEDTGRFGINIHRGGVSKVSSLGCQTIVPTQWQHFIAAVETEMKKHGQKIIPYVLTEEQM